MKTNELEYGFSDKSHYQKWLATDENFTHSIHIQPSSISEQSMYKIFDKVNWVLCKSFCKNKFWKYRDKKDRFNFVVFRQFESGRHYHLLVNSPKTVTRKVRDCVCNSNVMFDRGFVKHKPDKYKTCDMCVSWKLEELFKSVGTRLNNVDIKDTTQYNEYDGNQQIYVSRKLPTKILVNTKTITFIMYQGIYPVRTNTLSGY